MTSALFLATLTLALALLFAWAFPTLPQARWQFLAAMPPRRENRQEALSLTWYGFFLAGGVLAGSILALLLLGSLGLTGWRTGVVIAACLLVGLPAASLAARIVEGRRGTLTVAGAFFAVSLTLPALVVLMNHLVPGFDLPLLPVFAAAACGYALGEAIGRLSCLSFGCCYGRPVAELDPWLRKLLEPVAVRFHGATKKAAYAGGLEGRALVPIQPMTSIVFAIATVLGVALLLAGAPGAALLAVVALTQGWRVGSEFLRADWRGHMAFSAYQWMACAAVAWVAVLVALTPNGMEGRIPDLARGLAALWSPAVILGLQAAWLAAFLHTGRSTVTAAHASFFVRDEFLPQPPAAVRRAVERRASSGEAVAVACARDGLCPECTTGFSAQPARG